jgi:hypothetical protein
MDIAAKKNVGDNPVGDELLAFQIIFGRASHLS